MILLTPELHEQLLANGRDPDADHVPVAKFFNPLGPGVWLATHLDPDGDILWGLADLDLDCVEYGTFSLAELTGFEAGLGLGIERDLGFASEVPLSGWAAAARRAGSIITAEQNFRRAARGDELPKSEG